ncbi:tetratricopeptide repeat protein [Glutamicibacter sp. NPDC087344]|uniref:tetratricopeptide repeat protein n=1 Tax=Glutamicibacter sp. NPDC087344 TaxID=3363994 RepID=UPI0037F643EC
MKTKLWVGGILLLFALYIGMAFTQAFRFLSTDSVTAKVMGVAILVIPAFGVWILIREVLFGLRTESMGKTLAKLGELPEDLPRMPSGRFVREAADADFPRHQHDVEENPESWKSWYRLALAYEACGDKRRARNSMRTSIGFWLQERKTSAA